MEGEQKERKKGEQKRTTAITRKKQRNKKIKTVDGENMPPLKRKKRKREI